MSNVYIPDARMTMPELFYPGRKPVGKVKTDWNIASGLGLRNILVFNDSFKNKGETPPYTRNLFDNAGGASPRYNVMPDLAWLIGKSEFSICMGIKPRVVDGNNMIMGLCDSSAYQNHKSVAVWVDNLDFNSSSTNCISFQHSTSSSGSGADSRVISADSSIIAGKSYSVICRQDSVSAECLINGVQSGLSVTSLLKPVSALINEAYIGGITNVLTSSMDGEIDYIYVCDKKLTDAQSMSIHKNPYQFLVPA